MESKRGFTLIELLVVIAIIGMLASIVLASLDSARKKGRDARRVADMRQIQLALSLYYDSVGNYPLGLYSGTTYLGQSSTYISTVPKDPNGVACAVDSNDTTGSGAGSGCYRYTALAPSGIACQSYHLWTVLEVGNSTILASRVGAAAGTTCSGETVIDKAATLNAQIYDVKP